MQQFGYLDPQLVVKLLSVYGTALYGSSLWQLNCEEHLQLNRSWNTAMRIIWELPQNTHTRFIESLSYVPHLESVLTGSYLGFVGSLSSTSNTVLSIIFRSCSRNVSTQTGQNIRYLMDKHRKGTLEDLVNDRSTIKKTRVYNLPEEESWKILILKDMALVKRGLLELDVFDDNQVETILGLICTN